MKKSVTLEERELKEAVRAYVEAKTGFQPSRVNFHCTKGDRPWENDYWTATVEE